MFEWLIKAFLLSLPATLLTWLLAPLLALLSMRRKNLPWFLCWLGQYDDDLDGSLDPGWRSEHILTPDKGWRKWCNRTRWMWRNPAQYFDYWVLGIPVWDNFGLYVEGDPLVSDSPYRPGWVKKIVGNFDGREAFFYRRVFKWPFIKRCCDMKMGYAVWDDVQPRQKAKLVFTPISFSKMG